MTDPSDITSEQEESEPPIEPDDSEDDPGESEAADVDTGVATAAGQVRLPTIKTLPAGYTYGVTRYADVILEQVFPERLNNIIEALEGYNPPLQAMIDGGGGRTSFTADFDRSLEVQRDQDGNVVWGKKNITIAKSIGFDGAAHEVSRVRGHEIDMFGVKSVVDPFPGVAVEMEWNNKDPFFDRDLNNFLALHHEGAIAVGVIVTRSAGLQWLLERAIGPSKYGKSTTHWDKLIPKVNLGGGGECPLLLIGIGPERVGGREPAEARAQAFQAAADFKANWRTEKRYKKWAGDAKLRYDELVWAVPELD